MPLQIVPPEEPLWTVPTLEAMYVIQSLAIHDKLLRGFAHRLGARGSAAVFSQMPEVVFSSSVDLEALTAAVGGVTVVAILMCIQVIFTRV